MGMIVKEFRAFLTAGMDASTQALYIDPHAYGDLLTMFTNKDDYMYLSIRGDHSFETVKAWTFEGKLYVERGVCDTVPQPHHYGSAVTSISPTVVCVVRDMVDKEVERYLTEEMELTGDMGELPKAEHEDDGSGDLGYIPN